MNKLVLSVSAAAVMTATIASTAHAGNHCQDKFTFAVIGDAPYGQDQFKKFPEWVKQINADQDVEAVIHVGDTKSGGDECSDEWNNAVLGYFNDFRTPLIYTPGDNEWTDCHRKSNGSYNPLERLDAIRSTYFPVAGQTLGEKKMRVHAQRNFPENVWFQRDNVTFVTAHIVGSNNGALPWKGLDKTEQTPEQVAEHKARMAAAVRWLDQTFIRAHSLGNRAVVLNIHADMFYRNKEGVDSPSTKYASEFKPFVQALARNAAKFGKPVYLINGDTHKYLDEKPLTEGRVWLDFYDVPATPNVHRIMVDGSKNANNYLKVTVNPYGSDEVLSYKKVPFTS